MRGENISKFARILTLGLDRKLKACQYRKFSIKHTKARKIGEKEGA